MSEQVPPMGRIYEFNNSMSPAVSMRAGSLSAATVDRWLDEMWWCRDHYPEPPRFEGLDDFITSTTPGWCGAVLFPLPDDPLTSFLLWAQEPVHPDVARQCGPVQGPRPAVCARDPHPDSPYHWDGKGTWWR
jgi:hypothetical protein